MGVKYFWSWISNKFPQCIKSIGDCVPFDRIFIDLNGPIHQACQTVYDYGDNSSILSKYQSPKIEDVVGILTHDIGKLFRQLKVQKSIFIAIDGVAPKAKQNQQRGRRFLSEYVATTKFDPNCITAGTDFMKELSFQLDKHYQDEKMITVSQTNVPGEGEHKCIRECEIYSRDNLRNEKYGVVGIDTDLIIIGLMTDIPNLYIVRNEKCVDIDHLKLEIKKILHMPPRSFGILSFFCGNDFLPSIFKIKGGGLDSLVECYSDLTPLNLTRSTKEKQYFLNVKNIACLLEEIKCIPDKRLIPGLQENEDMIAVNYLKTMQWIYLYYRFGVPSWDWYYPHINAPDLGYLLKIAKNNPKLGFSFELGTPSSDLDQLLRVLPGKSSNLVPEEYRALLTSKSQKFKIIGSGWDSVVITDFV
jgi:5'-3' exonuclease